MDTNEKIAQLRQAMAAAGVQAYLIASSDPHLSEYLPAHWQARSYFSGFNGSAGTLVITLSGSGLWTDGRYFIQAQRQLASSEIALYRAGEPGVPTAAQFLADTLRPGEVLGLDGMVTSTALVRELEQAFAGRSIAIRSLDLVEGHWPQRPPMPATPAFLHDVRYTGLTARQKLDALRQDLRSHGATATMISSLPGVAWLLNLRASDVEYNPYILSHCFVTQQEALLFVDAGRIAPPVAEALAENGVVLRPYGAVADALAGWTAPETLWLDPSTLSFGLWDVMAQNSAFTLRTGADLVNALKAVKNETEIANIRRSHQKDGCAMVRFQMELEQKMAANAPVTELDVCEMLRRHRMAQPDCLGESFATIAAYGANAAMMHYHPTPENHCALARRGLLLVDSGAHYLDGTTDITRTYALGPLTEEERRCYTWVLKSNLQLNMAVFLEGCSGANVDILARSPLWRQGLDYRCGTGHGVGFLGGIHEGPHSMRTTNTVPLRPGMIVTDEPGVYEEGRLGVRIENELLCVQKMETAYGRFFGFEAVTYCPIDTTAVIPSLLSDEERALLNGYHQLVYDTLAPQLTPAEQQWLAQKTAPLGEGAAR